MLNKNQTEHLEVHERHRDYGTIVLAIIEATTVYPAWTACQALPARRRGWAGRAGRGPWGHREGRRLCFLTRLLTTPWATSIYFLGLTVISWSPQKPKK